MAAIGSALGEFSGYLVGSRSRKSFTKRYKKKLELFDKILKKYGSIVIFVFAATPLSDDLIFIPLGIMRYNILKAFIPALIGKFILNLIVVYGGRFSIEMIGDFFEVNDWMPAVAGMILGALVFIAMFKFDWEKYLEKYLARN